MKKVLTVLFLLTAVTGFALPNGYAVMRVFDCNRAVGMGGGYVNARIVIVYEDGKSEEVELLPFSEKNVTENMRTVVKTLNKISAQGYLLISQSTSGEQGSLVTDYTFHK
ncbi:MAG: hypothetical protein JNK66_08830 [Chitinophagales bacterium]|nr:hypothetical protein [Chitinophagales bacterium]